MKKNRVKLVVLCACALAIAAACVVGCSLANQAKDPALNTADTSGGVAAVVNGVKIGENAVTAYIGQYRSVQGLDSDDAWGTWLIENGYTVDSLRSETVDYYVNQELIRQAAAYLGVEADASTIDTQMQEARAMFDTDEAWQEALEQMGMTEEAYRSYVSMSVLQEALLKKVGSDASATDGEVLEYVKTYGTLYNGAKRMSQIVFGVDDKATAQEVLSRIQSGELSFSEAAGQYSTDTATAGKGGDVGWDKLQSAALVSEVQTALDGLEKGQTSELIETDSGIYLIECTDVLSAPEDFSSLDQVSAGFVETVREQVDLAAAQEAFSAYMNDFKEQAEVEINSMPDGLPYAIDLAPYEQAAIDADLSSTTKSATNSGLLSSSQDPTESADETSAASSASSASSAG